MPTLPPSILITPTSSTSQRKETLSSLTFLGGSEKLSIESASSQGVFSSSTIKSAKKTIEKKIEEAGIGEKFQENNGCLFYLFIQKCSDRN